MPSSSTSSCAAPRKIHSCLHSSRKTISRSHDAAAAAAAAIVCFCDCDLAHCKGDRWRRSRSVGADNVCANTSYVRSPLLSSPLDRTRTAVVHGGSGLQTDLRLRERPARGECDPDAPRRTNTTNRTFHFHPISLFLRNRRRKCGRGGEPPTIGSEIAFYLSDFPLLLLRPSRAAPPLPHLNSLKGGGVAGGAACPRGGSQVHSVQIHHVKFFLAPGGRAGGLLTSRNHEISAWERNMRPRPRPSHRLALHCSTRRFLNPLSPH